MEDYIFLILAILLSIFGAFNKSKKRRGEESLEEQAPVRKSRNDPFLNFEMAEMEDEEPVYAPKATEPKGKRSRDVNPFLNFEMMDLEDEEEEYERKLKQEQAIRAREIEARKINEATRANLENRRETAKDKIFKPSRFKSTLPERLKRESLKPTATVTEDEDTEESIERSSYLEDFSLRKAVIYSEILKPKYLS